MSDDDFDFDDPEELAAYLTFLEDLESDDWLAEESDDDPVVLRVVDDDEEGVEW